MTQTTAVEIRDIPLGQLHAHPDNPRLQLREDVVERLAAEIRQSGFGREHALLVRPTADGYQIISGHHRAEAARTADCDSAPCWVKDLGDDEAFMQLVLSNTQGELSPLEIGMHALVWSGEQKGYAERTGFGKSYISQLRSAADVASVYSSKPTGLDDKAKHLYEISKAPRAAWPALVAMLLDRGWTVADTKAKVDKLRKFEIPEQYREWLPVDEIAGKFLTNDRFNPTTVERLVKIADALFNLIEEDGTEGDAERLWNWLMANATGDSWDHKKLSDYHADVIREFSERREAEALAEIILPDGIDLRYGDFREILGDTADQVDAIITDPPYPAEFLPLFDDLAKFAASALKPGGICAVMIGQSYLPQIVASLGTHLKYHWTLAYLTPGGQAVQLWQRKVNTFWKPVLIYTNGEYAGEWLGDVTKSDVNDNDKDHHHWGQSESGMADLIGRLSKPGQLVCDPFLGGGTTAVVCHDLGRRFVGCDIDETAVQTSTRRFAREEPKQ